MSPYPECNLVSVVVPTHNRAGLLPRALASVWQQSYRPIELIAVDDGSTDNTRGVLARFQREHEPSGSFRFRCLVQKDGGGQRARNLGLKAAQGPYIRFLDDDDWLEADATRVQVSELQGTGADVCYGDWKDVFEDSSTGGRPAVVCAQPDLVDPIGGLLGGVWFPNFCYLLKTELARAIGGWSENYAAVQDMEFILRAAYSGATFARAPVVVGNYYHHASARVSRRSQAVKDQCIKHVIFDGIALLDKRSEWNEARRSAVAGSLFAQARHHFQDDRAQFRELVSLMWKIAPNYWPGKGPFKLVSLLVGPERAELLRRTVKTALGIK